MMVMSACVAAAAGIVGGGVDGCLLRLVVVVHVLLMHGLMDLLMLGVKGLVLPHHGIGVFRRGRGREVGPVSGITDEDYEGGYKRQPE